MVLPPLPSLPTQRKPPVKFEGEPSSAAAVPAAAAAPDASADVKDLRGEREWFACKEVLQNCIVGPKKLPIIIAGPNP